MSNTKFEKAVAIVQGLPKGGPVKVSQEQQLEFYALYKQGTIGDVNTTRPGLLDFVGKAKWDAWKQLEGKSKEEAQKEYVELLLKVLKASGTSEGEQLIKEIEEA
ncbi:acyl-CoA-binding protein [Dacryopinax primogenitus]|uniref:Acyl-CoA-binding protein n=1 Tax=Dacryopinax primogenitus (strain DJM 731) TaxID=1858805 RepID=M5GG86_DACPD|nr:acyl-CoA-binding protein [Dacryopinax primogenitus]EJU05053.1 acyl-CoA-binding protein [Dacryopinax primogenitus]